MQTNGRKCDETSVIMPVERSKVKVDGDIMRSVQAGAAQHCSCLIAVQVPSAPSFGLHQEYTMVGRNPTKLPRT